VWKSSVKGLRVLRVSVVDSGLFLLVATYLISQGCTSATVKTMTATATPTASQTPLPSLTPTSVPTVTPAGMNATFHVKTKNELGSVSCTFIADVYDSLTLADLTPVSIAVTPPAGVLMFINGATPYPTGSPVSILTTAPLTATVGEFDSSARTDGLFEVPLAAGDVYGFRGNSAAYGTFAGTAPVEKILALSSPLWVSPGTPTAGQTFNLTWGAVPGSVTYAVIIFDGFFQPAWPPSGFLLTTATTAQVNPGLAAGGYYWLVIATDDPLTSGVPLALTNYSLALRTITVQ